MTESSASTEPAKRPAADDTSGPLRAALLALGVGLAWLALGRWRRRQPADVW